MLSVFLCSFINLPNYTRLNVSKFRQIFESKFTVIYFISILAKPNNYFTCLKRGLSASYPQCGPATTIRDPRVLNPYTGTKWNFRKIEFKPFESLRICDFSWKFMYFYFLFFFFKLVAPFRVSLKRYLLWFLADFHTFLGVCHPLYATATNM